MLLVESLFLLKCNYKIGKLPVKLSNFYKQALLAWKLIYKHSLSPTNPYILYANKSLTCRTWFDHGIIWVKQLVNDRGRLVSYQEFMYKFQFPVPAKEYAVMFDAVPRGVLQLLRGSGTYDFILPTAGTFNRQIVVVEIDKTKKRCSNKYVRNCIQTITLPLGQSLWNSFNGEMNWQRAWMVGEKFCLNCFKVKEVSFKILHKIYPAQKILARFNIDMICYVNSVGKQFFICFINVHSQKHFGRMFSII